jgi:general secretion pathway protein J
MRIHTVVRSKCKPRFKHRGFTLIELLVALSVMALLALLSWRSIDGMTRAQTQVSARSDDALTLQASLAQFKFDLDAITQTPGVNSLDWDGRVLRMTRLASVPGEGLQVVAWTRRFDGGGQWLRWQSPVSRVFGDWRQAWEQASVWAQTASAESKKRETFLVPLSEWQIFYFRNNAWSNPLSSDGSSAVQGIQSPAAQVTVPDGIRVILTLPPGQSFAGKLTLDWVRPTLGSDKP